MTTAKLTNPLTDSELARLIWGLKAEGFHQRLLAGLVELQQRRKDEAAEREVIHCYHYNAEMKTSHRTGYVGTRERVADRASYYHLMELIGELNNDTVTGIVSLGYLGETSELLQEQDDCQQMAVNGGAE